MDFHEAKTETIMENFTLGIYKSHFQKNRIATVIIELNEMVGSYS